MLEVLETFDSSIVNWFQYFTYLFVCTVDLYTPYLGGVRSGADIAKFCYTNKERILERELQGYWHCWKYEYGSRELSVTLLKVHEGV